MGLLELAFRGGPGIAIAFPAVDQLHSPDTLAALAKCYSTTRSDGRTDMILLIRGEKIEAAFAKGAR